MLTLQILIGYLFIGTVFSIMLLKDGYKRHAKIMFLELTLGPVGFLLTLILFLGIVPLNR